MADDPAALAERRHGRRHITVLRVAKVVRPHGDELCVIRNISDGGVMAHLYAPAQVGEHVAIEFKSGARLDGTVRWARGDDAGIQFDHTIDIAAFLAGEGDVSGVEPRAPRLEVGMPAVMRVGVRMRPVTICNISQGGLKFRAIEGIEPDQAVVARIAGLEPLAGRVRWRHDEFAGLEFDAPIAFPVLARWAAEAPGRLRP
ncbi:PilZ domain-containing protein [Sphingomonas sp.]|uniref:PilZ domain-containing protein n=1 Tax=Sphingomonas sp. TaxID=28214 RepID=UPI002DD6A08D|nr:PilZ domain-containing protein [Sphingomonas sp.]